MLRGAALTLREPKAADPTKPKIFRLPESFRRYLKGAAVKPRTETDVVLDALALDRDLGVLLQPYRARLKAFAEGLGLDLDRHLPKVLAELIVLGLEGAEKERRSKR